ncbi:unnamed protein product [Echinostoma caproni]|uniref:DDE-1 domain-containing protein n=1 Tax=Echinostoma caproni TaxID=27848 RepID=A0A183ADN8_9TREM|nr:unnamed protein product [Echinostoma caproni]
MRALTIYTKEFMLKIKDVIVKNHTAMFEVPVANQAHKYCKRGKRIRAGWQTVLGRTTPSKMTVPTIESWLNEDVDDSVVQLDNFVCFRQDR